MCNASKIKFNHRKYIPNAHLHSVMHRMDGCMDGARMWHAYMTSFLHVLCAILEEKKITDNFRGLDRSGPECSH